MLIVGRLIAMHWTTEKIEFPGDLFHLTDTALKVFLAPSKNGYLLWPLNGVIEWVIS